MEEKKIEERSFELRSEKVRSIVGQIPPALTRYGITIIGVVLLIFLGIAYYIPYKQVYSGIATLYNTPTAWAADSIEVKFQLRFEHRRMDATKAPQPIQLLTPQGDITGTLLTLSTERDTLGRQTAFCLLPMEEARALSPQEFDFRITQSSGTLLHHFFGIPNKSQ